MLSGMVFDIKKFSLHDGPGIRTTVFLKGCPLTCSWCHNPESQLPGPEVFYFRDRCLLCEGCLESCPHGATALGNGEILTDGLKCRACGVCADACPAEARQVIGREMSVEEVMREIEKDQLFYEESQGGVTFSGGEPMMQPLFLIELLKRCGELGLHRTVDTCGQVGSSSLRDVARHTDLFLFDLKHMDSDKHRKYTGVGNNRILRNLRWLAESGAVIKIRVPLVPGVNDDPENISQTAAFVSSLPGRHEIHLLPFHSAAGDKHRRFGMPYQLDVQGEGPPEKLPLIKRLMEDHGLTVRVGG